MKNETQLKKRAKAPFVQATDKRTAFYSRIFTDFVAWVSASSNAKMPW